MPAFISHLTYLNKFWVEMGYPESFQWDGILGSMLPDVRYITKQDRKLTHLKEAIKDAKTYGQLFNNILGDVGNKIVIQGASPKNTHHFRIGFAFHIALDQWWPKQIYFPSDFDKIGACLKLLDDILLVSELDKINTDELKLPYKIKFLELSDALIEKWYNFVFDYIKKRPTLQNIEKILVEGELFDKETAREISRETNEIFNESDVKNKLQEMFESFSWKEVSKIQIPT